MEHVQPGETGADDERVVMGPGRAVLGVMSIAGFEVTAGDLVGGPASSSILRTGLIVVPLLRIVPHCVVDLVEVVVGHHPVDGEAAELPELEQPRQEQLGHAVALDDAAHDSPEGEDVVDVQGDLGAKGRRADHPALAGRGEGVDGGSEHGGLAARLEREIGAAAGDAPDLLADVGLVRVDDVRRAELAGELEPGGLDVDSDDRRAPGDHACHDRREPDGSRAEHRERAPRLGPHHVQHGAGAGLDPAAERGRELEARELGQLDDVALGGDRVGREAGLPEEVSVHDLAVARKHARAVGREAAKLRPKKSWQ